MLDYSTCVIADKFGSISVIRLPDDTNEDTQVRVDTISVTSFKFNL